MFLKGSVVVLFYSTGTKIWLQQCMLSIYFRLYYFIAFVSQQSIFCFNNISLQFFLT